MKVVVCGSRSWSNRDKIRERLSDLPDTATIIHGGAHGADAMAGALARALGFPDPLVFPADWKRLGRRAGIIRNLEMLDENPDLVLAFWDGESPGTRHMVSAAQKRGFRVEVIHP